MASVKLPAPMSQSKHLNLVTCEPQPNYKKRIFTFFYMKETASENIKNIHDLSVPMTIDI
jgi:hypothetical protein